MGKLSINNSDITSIYNDYHPAYRNLYTVEIYDISTIKYTDFGIRGKEKHEESVANLATINNYIKFHATKVSFDEESLNLKRNAITKHFTVENSTRDSNTYKWPDKLFITWRESDDWQVKKYHEDWIAKFYDKSKDCYISYPVDNKSATSDENKTDNEYSNRNVNSLSRIIKISLPLAYAEQIKTKKPTLLESLKSDIELLKNKENNILDVISQKYNDDNNTNNISSLKIKFKNVMPNTQGKFDFAWGNNPSIVEHQMSYFVEDWVWEENDEEITG